MKSYQLEVQQKLAESLGNAEVKTFGADNQLKITTNYKVDIDDSSIDDEINGIFKTDDGGLNWFRQNSANYDTSSSFANVVYFWDENVGFAQGDPINGEFELYVTENGGDNWTQVPGNNIPNPLGGEYGYTRQIEVVGNNVWFTTNKGRIYKSSDKGNNWDVFQSPITDFGSAEVNGDISFGDAQNGILIDNSVNVYRTENGGETWFEITTSGPVYTSGLCYIEGTNTVFSTGNGSSFSLDGGYSWTPIDNAVHLFVDFLNNMSLYYIDLFFIQLLNISPRIIM